MADSSKSKGGGSKNHLSSLKSDSQSGALLQNWNVEGLAKTQEGIGTF